MMYQWQFKVIVTLLIIQLIYVNNLYYTRRLNSRNFLNNSADFRTEPRFGANNRLNSKNCPNLKGAINSSNTPSRVDSSGAAGFSMDASHNHSVSGNTANQGGNESRPRNIAMMYIIKT